MNLADKNLQLFLFNRHEDVIRAFPSRESLVSVKWKLCAREIYDNPRKRRGKEGEGSEFSVARPSASRSIRARFRVIAFRSVHDDELLSVERQINANDYSRTFSAELIVPR